MSSNKEYVPIFEPSLPVPNVQEMAKKKPQQVPERYLRFEEEDMPNTTDISSLCSEIPVVDLSLLMEENEHELQKLDLACKEWGFFQVVNHGAGNEVLQNMKDSTANFFELPLEEKNKYEMASNDTQGYGHAYVVSEEQKLDWSDALLLFLHPTRHRILKFWPFKDVIEAFSAEMRQVAEKLLCSLSRIMGMEMEALLELHEELGQALRVNYYPTYCRPNEVLGISPHSDTSTITLLMQDDYPNGLQIHHDGIWVPVQPIPNALVVNVGDVIEIWSNGKYKSVEHRAVTNENKPRISYATFFIPNEDVEIEPLDQMVDTQRPLRMYKKVRYGDYLNHSLKKKLDGKTQIQMAKI